MTDETAFANGEHVTFLRRAQSAFSVLDPGLPKTVVAAALVRHLFAALPPDTQQRLLAWLQGQAGKKPK